MARVRALVQRPLDRLLLERHGRRRLPVLTEGLADPDLRDVLEVVRGHAGVQRVRVQLAVHEAREEDDRSTLLRPHLEVDAPEKGAAAAGDVVEVHEHGGDALAAVLAERAPGVRVRVDAVVVLDVPLRVCVARHLWQFHVAVRLVREQLHLLEQERTGLRILGQVARQARAALGRLAACDRVGLRALQQWAGGGNQQVALLVGEEVVADINRGRVVHSLQSWVAEVHRHVVWCIPHHQCLATRRLLAHRLGLWSVDTLLLLLGEHLSDVTSESGPRNKLQVWPVSGVKVALWLC
mmetsp:Transcript_18154/g.43138  ORF Transcript_18154/g.43138 Transcript_18154/m.43138 type:complete len:295 (-) Transcript_18154:57-941(-)